MAENWKDRARQNKLEIIIFVVLLLGCILWACSLFLPHWTEFVQPGTSDQYHYGLFLTCVKLRSKTLCMSTHIDRVSGGWSSAVRVFGSVAGILYILTVIASFLAILWERVWKKRLLFVIAGLVLITGICTLITVSVYALVHKDQLGEYGAAFYLAVISMCLLILAFPLTIYFAFVYSWKDSADITDDDGKDNVSFDMPHFLEREATNNFGPLQTKMSPAHNKFPPLPHFGGNKSVFRDDDSKLGREQTFSTYKPPMHDDEDTEKKNGKKYQENRNSEKINRAFKNMKRSFKKKDGSALSQI